MDKVTLKDKTFYVSISEHEIQRKVKLVGEQLNRDLAGEKPIFLVVLNGAFVFAADLLREINIPIEVRFIRLSSYEGVKTTGHVTEVLGLDIDVKDRHLIVVEDIVDSGTTMKKLLEILAERQAKSVEVASLLVKPDNLKVDINIKYRCFEIPNDFIVGYGLDYDELGRNLRNIYTVVDEQKK